MVDAIQGLGQVSFDVADTPVDILACGGQKWLLSPWGSGFLYVRGDLLPTLVPPFAGWQAFQGTDNFSRLTEYDPSPRADARRFEVGTLPFQDLAGMTESVALLLELGISRIAEYLRQISRPVIDAAERGAFELRSPIDTRHRSAIMSVRTEDSQRTHRALKEARVVCALREGTIRLSPHCYNTVDELERVTQILIER